MLTGGVSKCRWEVGGGLKKFLGGFLLLNFYFSVYFNHFLPFCDSFSVVTVSEADNFYKFGVYVSKTFKILTII